MYDIYCENHNPAGIIAGQAMTKYKCVDCGQETYWSNTFAPKRCRDCAEKAKLCMWCDEPARNLST